MRSLSENPNPEGALEKKLERLKLIDPEKAPVDSDLHQTILRQQKRLMTADIILLQEMDIGVKRSGYVNAAKMLADALNMNYAYGAEQLEVDPVMLGLEKLYFEDETVDQEATDYYQADPAKEKGAFGAAVLSRYPIKNVEVFQLDNQPYDWYWKEKEKTSFLEIGRRIGTKTLFKNEITREMKVGGRIYFRVDLHVPELPGETLEEMNTSLGVPISDHHPNVVDLPFDEPKI